MPVLEIDENGTRYTVWDSLAICETLAERHPDAELWPDDPKARAIARSYSAEMHAGFPDVREQLTMEFARRLPTPALRDSTKAQIERIIAAWSDALDQYGMAADSCSGGSPIADCMYAPVVSRFVTYGIALPSDAQAYSEKMLALPGMADWGRAQKRKSTQASLSSDSSSGVRRHHRGGTFVKVARGAGMQRRGTIFVAASGLI